MCADMYPGGLPGRIPATTLLGLQPRHKVFVSYHHANDQLFRDYFEKMFTNVHDVFISTSVQAGDIDTNLDTETIRQKIRDENLRDTTVTVVLVGTQTWQRKHVDWEISSSIRNTKLNPRSGLVGILLPSYKMLPGGYNSATIPPRLYYNNICGYATIYRWSDKPEDVSNWIHEAFERRTRVNPDNSYPSFGINRCGEGWNP